VTLNTFLGCRFAAVGVALRVFAYADTNSWFGGRVEQASTYGLVINDSGGANQIDSCLFSGVTFDGTPGMGVATTYIAPCVGSNSIVAKFDTCHFTGSVPFNTASPAGLVKVVDCPNFGAYSGGAGDYASPQGITPAASPYTYTNTNPYAIDLVVAGGSVKQLAFQRSGISTNLGLTSGVFRLQPGDGKTLTYATAPGVLVAIQQ
jgi:hypothetical protein